MSSSRVELLRGAFEMIENLEKALAQALAYKERYVSASQLISSSPEIVRSVTFSQLSSPHSFRERAVRSWAFTAIRMDF